LKHKQQICGKRKSDPPPICKANKLNFFDPYARDLLGIMLLYFCGTKMSARCESIGKFVLPVYRSLVAKELISTYHLTQVEAAKKLKTSQAAVSQYMNSKRAIKGIEQFNALLPRIQAEAKKTAKQLAGQQVTWEEVTIDFCKLCTTFCRAEENKTGEDYTI
jgi:predicted transcriptional regulator